MAVNKLKLIVSFILKPYLNRIKLGEGGLVIFNLFHSIYAHPFGTELMLRELALSFFAMCSLYGLNDYIDRQNDIHNNKKDRNFVLSIVQNEKLFISLNLLLALTTLLLTLLFLNPLKALVVFLLYLVNYLYSAKLKSFPLMDVITVIAWGGLYVLLSGDLQFTLAVIAGVMTGISHFFQMITDEISDRENNIKTTVVALPGMKMLILSGLCILLGVLLFLTLGGVWSITCVLPVLVYMISNSVKLSWHLSRGYFFVCWLQLLIGFYGSI